MASEDEKPSRTKSKKMKVRKERKRILNYSSNEEDSFNSSPRKEAKRHSQSDSHRHSRHDKVRHIFYVCSRHVYNMTEENQDFATACF